MGVWKGNTQQAIGNENAETFKLMTFLGGGADLGNLVIFAVQGGKIHDICKLVTFFLEEQT